MNNALLVFDRAFPYGDAMSARIRSFLLLLNACGYYVHLVVLEGYNYGCADLAEAKYVVHYVKAPQTALTLLGIGTGKPYMSVIKKLLKEENIELVISGRMEFVSEKIRRITKKHNIKYIVEQCEWFDVSSFKFGKYNPFYMEHIRLIQRKNRKVDGVIAISRLFEKYYKAQNLCTIRMPTVFDVKGIKPNKEKYQNNQINLIFAGTIGKGKKENIIPILKALEIINHTQKVYLNIYGPTETQVLDAIDNDVRLLEAVKPYIIIHGKIPQSEVLMKYSESDFSVFIRPNRRSSDAGFPTKFAESMAVGTPVICNITGDIDLYLNDGKNGFIVKDGEKDIITILNRIQKMSYEERMNLRLEARRTALEFFDYRSYKKEFKGFIEKIVSCS